MDIVPDRLSIHAPILVNTIGHCAGAIIFGILLYLLLLDWKRASAERSALLVVAAGLALLWNLGSLIGMATSPRGDPVADAIVAASFWVLSLLPAVLLHISLRSRHIAIWMAGSVVSSVAVALHIGDLVTGAPRFHYAAILLAKTRSQKDSPTSSSLFFQSASAFVGSSAYPRTPSLIAEIGTSSATTLPTWQFSQ